jgi:hypothetical protein
MIKMRFSLVGAVLLVAISATGVAQQQKFKVKRTPAEKTKKVAVPLPKSSVGATGASSKDLQALEHQTAKSSMPRTPGKKSAGAAAIRPIKDKPNPPINLGSGGGASGGSTVGRAGNPYKGRLKQKYGRQ